MTYRRQMLAVLAGFLLAAAWASGSSAHPASHATQHQVVIDSTNYQSEEQLLANTQVMVVAKVESVAYRPVGACISTRAPRHPEGTRRPPRACGEDARCRATPRRPTSSGSGGSVTASTGPHISAVARPISGCGGLLLGGRERRGVCVQRHYPAIHKTGHLGTVGDLRLSALLGQGRSRGHAGVDRAQLAQSGWPAGPQTVSWSSMANDLGMSLTDVSCPSEDLCLFAGEVTPPTPGWWSQPSPRAPGHSLPQANVVGTTTTFPPSSASTSGSFVACAGAALCVLSSADGVYVTTDPTAAHWTLEVAPSPGYSFGQASCPKVSFCAVATGSGVLVSESPSSGPSAWNYIHIGTVGQAISCPSPQLCVAGGYGNATVGGWIETSSSPLVPASWHGGPTPHPSFAQHSGQYGVTGISCPSAAFCVAAVVAGEPLVSTDPAGGVGTWSEATNGSMDNPGFAACTTAGQCSVSGVGSFTARSGAPGPGITGYPLPGVSCLSTTFCVTVTGEQLAVAAGAG